MTNEEQKVIAAAALASRYLPPSQFMRQSPGYKACKALCAAVKELRLARTALSSPPPHDGEARP